MKVGYPCVVQVVFILILLTSALSRAAVEGDCSTCHTMHNSEDGAAVTYILDSAGQRIISEQPMANLLKTDCLGCHSAADAETIVSLGADTVPVVFNFTEPTYPPDGSTTSSLAGGNFHWMIAGGDPYGHNVYGISGEDLRFPVNQAPGGEERTGQCANCHGSLATAQSGCQGCHVVEHHDGGSGDVAGQGQGWYRFLGSVMQRDDQLGPTPEGVIGIEAPDWEQNPMFNQHNVYQGSPAPHASYLETGAISQKCAGCHGLFHDATISSTTWIRHPVDAAIPNAGEFSAMTTYDPQVPVARQGVSPADINFSTITLGSDMVSCISCHRAHGSPYPAMLRWGYRDWPGTDSHTSGPALNGCAVCHTAKD